MTTNDLLFALKDFTEKAVKDLRLPVKMQENDQEQPPDRAPEVHLMRLPDSSAAKKKAPYILHIKVTGDDSQDEGQRTQSLVTVRTVFCVYDENEESGALSLNEVMERLRIAFLKKRVVDHRFELKLKKGQSLENLVYTEDTAPYYVGEMVSTWELPAVEREVKLHEQVKEYF